MDRGSGRSIFKNPPQPFMCIQDSLVGSSEPCFINVLAWEKISEPSHPTHQIPLFGGMKIKNSSLNSLSITDLYEGIKDGKQPLIFAVCANTKILQLIGKGTNDANERDALIFVILEFIEAMNMGIKFQCKFKVLPDRDVIGELKDIWFIIQSKRDQEKIELCNAETKRQIDKMKGPTNWYYRDSDIESKTFSRKEYRHDGNVGIVQLGALLSGNASGKQYVLSNLSHNGTKNKHVSREKNSSMPSNDTNQSPAMKDAIDWSKRAYTSSHLASVNYSISHTSHSVDNTPLKPLPPSFNESIEMKAREVKSAAMNQRNKTETVGPTNYVREDLLSSPDVDYAEINMCKHSFAPDKCTPSNECLHHASISAGPSYHVLNSYESELAMCDQLWHGIATECPSLDVGRNMSNHSPLTGVNGASSSNILVKSRLLIADIMDSMTELSNDAPIGNMSDEILDVQESYLVKELTEFDAMSFKQYLAESAAIDIHGDVPENNDLTSATFHTSAHGSLDQTKSVAYRPSYISDLSKLPKSNSNIPLSVLDKSQANTHLVNELNKNIDLSQQYNSGLTSINSDASENVENFVIKTQKDNNDNVDA